MGRATRDGLRSMRECKQWHRCRAFVFSNRAGRPRQQRQRTRRARSSDYRPRSSPSYSCHSREKSRFGFGLGRWKARFLCWRRSSWDQSACSFRSRTRRVTTGVPARVRTTSDSRKRKQSGGFAEPEKMRRDQPSVVRLAESACVPNETKRAAHEGGGEQAGETSGGR